MADKKRSGGLAILLSNVPGEGELVELLSTRGLVNPEKLPKGEILESFPGGCQIAVHGRVKEEESELDALYREVQEEFGSRARPTRRGPPPSRLHEGWPRCTPSAIFLLSS